MTDALPGATWDTRTAGRSTNSSRRPTRGTDREHSRRRRTPSRQAHAGLGHRQPVPALLDRVTTQVAALRPSVGSTSKSTATPVSQLSTRAALSPGATDSDQRCRCSWAAYYREATSRRCGSHHFRRKWPQRPLSGRNKSTDPPARPAAACRSRRAFVCGPSALKQGRKARSVCRRGIRRPATPAEGPRAGHRRRAADWPTCGRSM